MTPRKLGRYEIVGELGKGAMGLVYLARDPIIGRQLALKTFRLGFSAKDADQEQFKVRFLREAQSAGILSHPNIVTIHDVVVDESGEFVIAMEYVKGTDLKQLMQRQGRLEVKFVVDVIAQIADGLDYAHQKGVVHRDIKPANIILTADKKAKITDFGIARVDASNLTVEGQLLGTPNYMAPEQIQGREVDHRADLFSLGVMLYELVTGKKPFQGENLTMVTHKIVYDAFTPPQELVVGLPERLVLVLQKALQKDPTKRYQSGSEMATDLRAVFSSPALGRGDTATSFLTDLQSPAAGQMGPGTMGGSTAGTGSPVGGTQVGSTLGPAHVGSGQMGPGQMGPGGGVQSAASMPYPLNPSQTMAGSSGGLAPGTLQGGVSGPGSSSHPQIAVAAPEPSSRGLIAGAILVLLLVFAGVGYLAFRPSAGGDGPATLAPDLEADLRDQWQPLVEQGQEALRQGDAVRAIELFERALVVMPGDKEIRELRAAAEQMALDSDLTLGEAMIRERLSQAEDALAGDDYDRAEDLVRAALEIDSENEKALRLLASVDEGQQRLKDAKDRVQGRFRRPVVNPDSATAGSNPAGSGAGAGSSSARPGSTQVAMAQLEIAFDTKIPEGILTVYVGSAKLFHQNFKFSRGGGQLSHQAEVPAGSTKIRVYVWRNGSTVPKEISADMLAGTARILRIALDGDGGVRVGLQ